MKKRVFEKYDETHLLGPTTVHIVHPEPMSDETLAKRIRCFLAAAQVIYDNFDDPEE